MSGKSEHQRRRTRLRRRAGRLMRSLVVQDWFVREYAQILKQKLRVLDHFSREYAE